MFEKMMNLINAWNNNYYDMLHDIYWFGEEDPSPELLDRFDFTEAMLSIWNRQHAEFLARKEQENCTALMYERMECELCGIRVRG